MAEENFVEQDLGNVQQMENAPEDLDNVPQIDNVAKDFDNVQQIDNVAKDFDNVEQMENAPEGLDNVQQIDNVAEDFDNVQQMDNVPEDLDNVQQVDNVSEDLDNVPQMDNLPEDLNNMEKMDNVPEDLGNVQQMDNVPEDLGNVQQMDNVPEDLGNVQRMDNVPEDLGNVQQMDNVPEILHSREEGKGDENDSRVVEEKKWPGWPGENVFRMLVPVQRVGGIIGRKGEYIKKVCEDTRARIKILDGPPGTTERAVLVSAKEEPDLPIPPALDGLLKIHKRIIDPDSDAANAQSGGTVCTRLLVAATQAGSLIGKQGATIKTIQDDSNCTIRVLGENLPMFALPDDSVVEIQGEPTSVHKAVELIASHLRKFLVDRSVVGVFEMQMQNTRASHNAPPPQSWGPPPSAFPMNPHGHGSNPPFMAPHPRQYDNYYPPADMSPLGKHPRSGPPTYGRDHTPNAQQQKAVIAKVTQNMQIPLSYADAVIGVNGANISYIRRASGATIAIQETRGVPGEMTVEINGSASQVQAAQQLIQNSLADAVNSAQANHGGGPPSQGYNPYPSSHGPVYGSQPSNAAGQGGHAPTGDYGSAYGGSYGY